MPMRENKINSCTEIETSTMSTKKICRIFFFGAIAIWWLESYRDCTTWHRMRTEFVNFNPQEKRQYEIFKLHFLLDPDKTWRGFHYSGLTKQKKKKKIVKQVKIYYFLIIYYLNANNKLPRKQVIKLFISEMQFRTDHNSSFGVMHTIRFMFTCLFLNR